MANYSLSKVRTFVEGCGAGGPWVGADVHKRSYHAALRREHGRSPTWVGPADPKHFVWRLLEIGAVVHVVAHEAGPTGFSLARTLKDAGIDCIVAAPSKIPRPVSPGPKTDRLDCIKLADYAARGMLRSIAVPAVEEESERALMMRRRHKLVDSLRKTKQHIKSLLLEMGEPEPPGQANWRKGRAGCPTGGPAQRGSGPAAARDKNPDRGLIDQGHELETRDNGVEINPGPG